MNRFLVLLFCVCFLLSSCAINNAPSSSDAEAAGCSAVSDKAEARQNRINEAKEHEETGAFAGFIYPGAEELCENRFAADQGFGKGLYFCDPSGNSVRYENGDLGDFIGDSLEAAGTVSPEMKYLRILVYSMGGASGYEVNDLVSALTGFDSIMNHYSFDGGYVIYYKLRRMMSIEEFSKETLKEIERLLDSENIYCVTLSLYETPYDRQAVEC